MPRPNKLRIVSNQGTHKCAFFLENENEEWVCVDAASPLSRKDYTDGGIYETAYKIIRVVDEIYNVGNRRVEIFFEGAEDEYEQIRAVLCQAKVGESVTCYQKKTIIAVAGKIHTGKTTLIEEIGKNQKKNYSIRKENGVTRYGEQNSDSEWYEVDGIDIGQANMKRCRETFERLAGQGLSSVVYCLLNDKIEKAEEELLEDFHRKYPGTRILLVLTNSVDEKAGQFAEQLENRLGWAHVIPVLAKEVKTRSGRVAPFGVERVIKYLYEGK